MRVIAGSHRGRKLRAAPEGVRPTTDRVRESLFAVLGEVTGDTVLDLFAGSGALGIEALSRGASELVAIDRAQRSLQAVRRNLEDLELGDRARVLRGDAVKLIPRLSAEGARFDLVFVDPPYDAGLVGPVLSALATGDLLAPGARVVVERAKRHSVPPVPGLVLDDERTYGDTAVQILIPAATLADPVEA